MNKSPDWCLELWASTCTNFLRRIFDGNGIVVYYVLVQMVLWFAAYIEEPGTLIG